MAAVCYYRRRNLRRNRIFRDRTNPFDTFSDDQLHQKFRFRRHQVFEIVDELKEELQHPNRTGALTPLQQVMVTLRFFATGSFQNLVADSIGVVQSTVSLTVRRVTRALLRQVHRWIKFPNQQKADKQKQLFRQMRRFPNVVGCVDGTHIRIQAPVLNENEYVNRKNYHSINTQVICNAQLVFIDVVARWPGSVHDARILRQSAVFNKFEGQNRPVRGYILADSGYMLRSWLLTPVANPRTPSEQQYNFAHSSTRTTVERAIGCAKKRWHCLQGLRVQPAAACEIITVCLMLHNRCRFFKIDRGDEDASDSEFSDSDHDSDDSDAGNNENENDLNLPLTERARFASGRAERDNLIRQFFLIFHNLCASKNLCKNISIISFPPQIV